MLLLLWLLGVVVMYYLSIVPWSLGLNDNYNVAWLAIDNLNMMFLLLIQLLFPLIAWMGNFETKTIIFSLIFDNLIVFNLFALFLSSNMLLFFVLFEFLIIILFILLLLFLQSYYSMSTSFFFFYYSIFGSISFMMSLLLWMMSSNSLLLILMIMPILMKMPSFPFFYWLPEVHSESNSSMSLLLAGLILKLSIYGLISFMLSSFYLSLIYLISLLLAFTIIGVLMMTCSCFSYFDLKKMMAFSSMLHLNLVFVALLSFNSCGLLSAMFMSLSHSFSSIALFLLAGLLINKTYTSYMDSMYMLDLLIRAILVLFVLSNLNIPGSINFMGEMLSLISMISIDIFYNFFFIFIAFLSSLFWFLMLNSKLCYNYCYNLCLNSFLVCLYLLFLMYYLGLFFLF